MACRQAAVRFPAHRQTAAGGFGGRLDKEEWTRSGCGCAGFGGRCRVRGEEVKHLGVPGLAGDEPDTADGGVCQAWADYLEKIKTGGEVVPFRKKSGARR